MFTDDPMSTLVTSEADFADAAGWLVVPGVAVLLSAEMVFGAAGVKCTCLTCDCWAINAVPRKTVRIKSRNDFMVCLFCLTID